jgi:hypothetical protein
MIPVQQLNRHDPPHSYGDCDRACIASILELPCAAVPNFCEPGPGETFSQSAWTERRRLWLARHGIVPIDMCYHESLDLDAILAGTRSYQPGIHFILAGESRNHCNHSVIACDGRIVHDPSLDQSGIIGPCDDGHYWAMFFGAGIAAQTQRSQS